MELVLHARYVREATGVEQVLEGDVAQANRRDQPVVAGRGHRGQLVVEEPVGPRRAHQPQVDDWQRVEIECPQVVLYAAAQLVRGVGGEDTAPRVATGADLADDDQLRRVRVERVADELVHYLGPIELRRVDVIDTGVDRLAQDC